MIALLSSQYQCMVERIDDQRPGKQEIGDFTIFGLGPDQLTGLANDAIILTKRDCLWLPHNNRRERQKRNPALLFPFQESNRGLGGVGIISNDVLQIAT